MKIVNLQNTPVQPADPAMMTGPATLQPLFDKATGIKYFSVSGVNFINGTRNKYHSHSVDQLLVVTSGHGILKTDAEQREVKTGDIIFVPAGEKHWHGAAKGQDFSHISILAAGNTTKKFE